MMGRLGRAMRRGAESLRSDRQLQVTLLAAAVAILPGAWWGVPRATHALTARGWEVDGIGGLGVLAELSNLTSAGAADWYVAYPLFHYLVLAVLTVPVLAVMVATGALDAPTGTYPYGFSDAADSIRLLAIIAHVVSAAMAVATVVALGSLLRRHVGRPWDMAGQGVLLLTAPFLFYARTSNLDVPVLCWVVLSYHAIDRAWSDGLTVRRALACGALAALAVATKDQAYGLLVPPLLLLAVRSWRAPAMPRREAMRALLALGVAGVIVFAVAGGLVVRPDRFARHLAYITNFDETFANVRTPTALTVLREASVAGYVRLVGDMGLALGTAIGWPAVVAGTAGLVAGWRQVTCIPWLVSSAAGFLVLVIAPIHHMQYRYTLGLAVVMAVGVSALLRRVSGYSPRAAMVALGVVLLGAAPGAAEVTHAMLVDARHDAATWLAREVRPPARIGFFGRPHQLPHLPDRVDVVMLGDGGAPRADLLREAPEWIVVAPEYFANEARTHSVFLPEDLFAALEAGTLGWVRVAHFTAPGLLARPLPYLPYVNPDVRVYRRRGGP